MTTVGDAALDQLFRTLERLPWPNPLMGKPEVDEQKLIEAIDRWMVLYETGTEAEHSACADLALAAAAWAYWKRDPYLVVHTATSGETPNGGTNG